MKIPKEYTDPERKAYTRGYHDCKHEIYRENGLKGAKNRWGGATLEDRIRQNKIMNEARKRKNTINN